MATPYCFAALNRHKFLFLQHAADQHLPCVDLANRYLRTRLSSSSAMKGASTSSASSCRSLHCAACIDSALMLSCTTYSRSFNQSLTDTDQQKEALFASLGKMGVDWNSALYGPCQIVADSLAHLHLSEIMLRPGLGWEQGDQYSEAALHLSCARTCASAGGIL